MSVDVQALLEALSVPQTAIQTAEEVLANSVSGDALTTSATQDELLGRAEILEHQAISQYKQMDATPGDPVLVQRARSSFSSAFDCLIGAAIQGIPGETLDLAAVDPEANLGLRIAVAGLASGRIADVRTQLIRLLPPAQQEIRNELPAGTWNVQVAGSIAHALIWLVRKADSWSDIDAAMTLLHQLRELQATFEDDYLDASDNAAAAIDLVGYYHLAQLSTLTAEYLSLGTGSYDGLVARLDRHHDHAVESAEKTGNGELRHFADLVWIGCRELCQNAIWTHALGLGDRVAALARSLASRARNLPIIDLWPSQQKALAGNLLDPYKRAVLVEMPTSAGKTLLAKFSIMQSKNLHAAGTIAYVVPTRALVNQVVVDLRNDLVPLGLTIEATVPVFELDPSEDALLQEAPGVLVTTPEKMDLLLRRNHPCTHDLAMVIVDEAHNLAAGQRGARLELVLATVRRDRPNVRFLLLSPFLPQADDLVSWLGGGRELAPIAINWKPGRRIVGALELTGGSKNRQLQFTALEAASNSDLPAGYIIPLGAAPEGSKSIKLISRHAASRLRDRGSTLILCWGPTFAMDRAREISQDLEEIVGSNLRDSVCEYIDAELGSDNTLSSFLRKGVAYHHAGLPLEIRWLIERLVQGNQIHTICGTTTLAQGVNFPISNVIIEDKRKGRTDSLSYSDLWNIAGRAGRAMMDDVGVVAFPVTTKRQHESWQQFLRGEAVEISSQLAEIVQRADEIGDTFNLDAVRRIPALGDLLQFLAHAMRVGGYQQTAENVEDLLRTSLIYHQTRQTDRDAATRLVRLCRDYLQQLSNRPGIAALSDQTGFSSPSINRWLALERSTTGLQSEEQWSPAVLFDQADVAALTDRMRAVADVPEMNLGSEYAGTFNPERVAQIVHGWVNGDTISSLASRFGDQKKKTPEDRLAAFASYLNGKLLGQLSWGIGALATVCLGGESRPSDDAVPEKSRHLPSMIFFGVKSQEAIWLRMAGVPRLVAPILGEVWRSRIGERPDSLASVRAWVSSLDDQTWQTALAGNRLSSRSMSTIWRELVMA